mgnify:CR=1 FL=1
MSRKHVSSCWAWLREMLLCSGGSTNPCPLAGWRGNGDQFGKGNVNKNQIQEYIENGCFHNHEFDQYLSISLKSQNLKLSHLSPELILISLACLGIYLFLE